MKRKGKIEPNNIKKKKHSTSSSTTNGSGDKTIMDFFGRPKEIKEETKKELRSKSKTMALEFENINKVPSKSSQTNLMKNPSKHAIFGNQKVENTIEYKNKILFNEDFIENIKKLWEPYLTMSLKSLVEHCNIFDLNDYKKIIEDFYNTHIDNILTKFIIQCDDNFIFIPRSFLQEPCKEMRSKLKFFEGFNETSKICLQYFPLNAQEVIFYFILKIGF
jgi:hypothetical protein